MKRRTGEIFEEMPLALCDPIGNSLFEICCCRLDEIRRFDGDNTTFELYVWCSHQRPFLRFSATCKTAGTACFRLKNLLRSRFDVLTHCHGIRTFVKGYGDLYKSHYLGQQNHCGTFFDESLKIVFAQIATARIEEDQSPRVKLLMDIGGLCGAHDCCFQYRCEPEPRFFELLDVARSAFPAKFWALKEDFFPNRTIKT